MNQEIINILRDKEELLEPDTIRHFEPDMAEEDVNKILAMATLYKTRNFWENFYSFENMVLALNGIVPNVELLKGTTPEQIWLALAVAEKIFPDREFSIEVQEYVRFIFNDEGIYIYPPYLGIGNPYYEQAVQLAEHGPFPLGETTEEIQAAKLITIKEYINGRITS